MLKNLLHLDWASDYHCAFSYWMINSIDNSRSDITSFYQKIPFIFAIIISSLYFANPQVSFETMVRMIYHLYQFLSLVDQQLLQI